MQGFLGVRFEPRWKLGQLLAKVERQQGARTDKTSSRAGTKFRAYLKEIGLDKNRANESERIAAIPDEFKLKKAFEEIARAGEGRARELRPQCRTCVSRAETPIGSPEARQADRDGSPAHRHVACQGAGGSTARRP